MHPQDSLLRAFIDQELRNEQVELLTQHLSGCPTCQTKLMLLQARAQRVREQMDLLSPQPHVPRPSYQAAFGKVIKKSRQAKPKKEFINTMSNRKSLWITLGIMALLVVVFTMTPASAWASNFLGLFRVQKVTVFEFDPAAAERNSEAFSAQSNAFDQILNDNLTISEGGKPSLVASLDEAISTAGFTPSIPDVLKDADFSVEPGMNATLVIDQPQMQALLDAFEIDLKLSPEMDGQTVTVDVPMGIVASNGCPLDSYESGQFGDCVALYQMPSPIVNAPEGLNVEKLGEAMLQLLGYSPQEARAFSQSVDWTSTLLIPIPSGEGIQYQDVLLNGTPATLFTHAEEPGYMLVFVKNNILFGLRGPGSAEEALAIGNAIP